MAMCDIDKQQVAMMKAQTAKRLIPLQPFPHVFQKDSKKTPVWPFLESIIKQENGIHVANTEFHIEAPAAN